MTQLSLSTTSHDCKKQSLVGHTVWRQDCQHFGKLLLRKARSTVQSRFIAVLFVLRCNPPNAVLSRVLRCRHPCFSSCSRASYRCRFPCECLLRRPAARHTSVFDIGGLSCGGGLVALVCCCAAFPHLRAMPAARGDRAWWVRRCSRGSSFCFWCYCSQDAAAGFKYCSRATCCGSKPSSGLRAAPFCGQRPRT